VELACGYGGVENAKEILCDAVAEHALTSKEHGRETNGDKVNSSRKI
jgi:hypothetical protein